MLGEYHYLLALVSVADMLDTPSFEFVLFRLPTKWYRQSFTAELMHFSIKGFDKCQ